MITVCILSLICYSCTLNVSLKTRCYNWLHVVIDGVTCTYHAFVLYNTWIQHKSVPCSSHFVSSIDTQHSQVGTVKSQFSRPVDDGDNDDCNDQFWSKIVRQHGNNYLYGSQNPFIIGFYGAEIVPVWFKLSTTELQKLYFKTITIIRT